VQRGDTLSAIAARNFPNNQRERALVALYKANPRAFSGNMNELHAGAQLQIPDTTAVAAVGPAEASAEVHSQYRGWASAHGGGAQLHLVAPAEPGTAAAGNASAGETAALQQKVTTLQAQLSESQRLLDLKNAELARLQAQIDRGRGATETAPAKTPPAVATAPAEAPAETPTTPAQPAVTAPEAAPAPQAVAKPPQPAARTSGSIFDWLLDNWYVPLGVIAVLFAALLGWRALRSRQTQEFDRTLDHLANPPMEMPARTLRPAETQPMRALHSRDEPSFVVEESGIHQAPRVGEQELAAMHAAPPVAVDDTVSGETGVALDQGDPLAEADFHMAYGLYDQAADLVRIAISREPQRRDLRVKLLEVFFVWGNRDQFLQLARELAASRDQAQSGEWEKIVIMGRQIAPDDVLFASGGALPGAASGGVDLNLEGGQNRVDFDLLGEPSMASGTSPDVVDLDLGAALSGSESTGEARAIGDTGVDFVLDDPARGSDSTGSTREMPTSQTVTMELRDPAADSPTVENPLHTGMGSPTIRHKLESSGRFMTPASASDRTAELALDDLGLDLSADDTGPQETTSMGADSSPTVLSSMDAETRQLLARTEATRDTAEVPAAGGHAGASGTWLFTDKDFTATADTQLSAHAHSPTEVVTAIMPRPETNLDFTGRIAALREQGGGAVDLNLDQLAATGRTARAVDLDVGAHAVQETGQFTQTQRLPSEGSVTDAEPATMSEVGTKLDLARAYMDMGDPEGARSILEEVLSEGSASQKTEARRLIDSLPG
jgi:pilus assembly protein FimV